MEVRHDQVEGVSIAGGFQYMLGETRQCAHVLCSFTSNARRGAVEPSSVAHIEIAGNNNARSLLPHSVNCAINMLDHGDVAVRTRAWLVSGRHQYVAA